MGIKPTRMRWVGYVACMEDLRKAHTFLEGKLQNERPVERPRHRWNVLWLVFVKGWEFIDKLNYPRGFNRWMLPLALLIVFVNKVLT
jgi:hypothetical protein